MYIYKYEYVYTFFLTIISTHANVGSRSPDQEIFNIIQIKLRSKANKHLKAKYL